MLIPVVGAQFGDEGKGRVVHNLCSNGDVVAAARPNGGCNAGHTIVDHGKVHKLHHIPSSVLVGKQALLGCGVVVNLEVLVQEIEGLKTQGYRPDLVIDDRVHIILPWHVLLDKENDGKQGQFAAGSTLRGIGPTYGAKHERWGVRLIDLYANHDRVDSVIEHYATVLGRPIEEFQSAVDNIHKTFSTYLSFAGNVSKIVEQHLWDGRTVIVENAQGEMLDVDNPYYPLGTSSKTNAIGSWSGLGIGPRVGWMGDVLGVAKAYVTRVGNGPFVTELGKLEGDILQQKGKEYGTTTGRPRRVGWFDVPMINEANRASGFTSLALTKIDVLGGISELKIAKAYKWHSQVIEDIPIHDYSSAVPVYEKFNGWQEFSAKEYRSQMENGISSIRDLNLKRFLEAVQEYTQLPISYVSFGEESNAFVSYK